MTTKRVAYVGILLLILVVVLPILLGCQKQHTDNSEPKGITNTKREVEMVPKTPYGEIGELISEEAARIIRKVIEAGDDGLISRKEAMHITGKVLEARNDRLKLEEAIRIARKALEASDDRLISEAEAIRVARKYIEGREYDKSLKVVVEIRQVYQVTFPVRMRIGIRGPSYAARVWIDAKSGRVLGGLQAP